MYFNEDFKQLSDAQLVKLFQEGDFAAIDVLVERYAPILLPFITKVLHNNTEDAKDVLQDTWVLVFLRINRGSYREENCFGKWIKTLAYHAAMDFHKRKNTFNA